MNARRSFDHRPVTLRFALGGALVAALACAGTAQAAGAPQCPAAQMAGAGQMCGKSVVQADPKLEKLAAKAEKAVAKAPADAALRFALGRAYMKVGRFESAVTALADAVSLGDSSPRAQLNLALAEIASGQERSAVARLDQARDTIPASDLGLAMALAGETGRGVAILADALRSGDKSMKIRENLAYAYALDGRWGEARMMVALDLPADKVDARLTEWAQTAQSDGARARVAHLLGVPERSDAGMPQVLALNGAAAPVQMAANDYPVAAAPAPAPVSELAPLADASAGASAAVPAAAPEPAPAFAAASVPMPAPEQVQAVAAAPNPISFQSAFAAAPESQPLAQPEAPSFTKPMRGSKHQAAAKPAAKSPSKASARRDFAVAAVASGGNHVVQLGAFSSAANAEKAKRQFQSRPAGLKGRELAITEAMVNGRKFWRVAAVGFDSASAGQTCGSLKRKGGACFAYAADRAPTGLAVAKVPAAKVAMAMGRKR